MTTTPRKKVATTPKKRVVRRKTTKPVVATPAPRKSATPQSAPVGSLSLATVPDKSFADTYIGRDIKGQRDFDIYDSALANQWNVLLEGPTGAAKTSSVLAYAAERELPFYSVSSSNGIEETKLFGKYIPATEGDAQFVWQDGPVTSLFRHGGVLLLNEINFIPERIQSVLFSALDKRRQIQLMDHKGEVITASPDLLIVGDLNDQYEGTRPLNKAFRNRFKIQIQWGYVTDIERQLVKSKSLLEMAARFRTRIAEGEFETPVGTNMLMEFEEIAAALGVNFAIENFVSHFSSDDREAARGVLQTYEANIVSDITRQQKPTARTRKPAQSKGVTPAKQSATSKTAKADSTTDDIWTDSNKKWAYGDSDDTAVSADVADEDADDDDEEATDADWAFLNDMTKADLVELAGGLNISTAKAQACATKKDVIALIIREAE